MKVKVINIFCLFIALLLITACEEHSNVKLSSPDSNLIAVEGIITNEKTNHRIRITQPYKIQNQKPVPVTGAIVQLTDETIVLELTETPAGSGDYYTPELIAVTGKVYTLSIQYQGKEYIAQDSAEPLEPLQALQYKKINDKYELILNAAGEEANYIDHYVTWKDTDACITESQCEGRVVFYDLKTIDVNDIYKPKKDEFTFPVNTTVIRKKYSISSTYKTFLRGMLSETQWRGGYFDVQRADVPTNLSEGAVGFFAVSTVISNTTLITELP